VYRPDPGPECSFVDFCPVQNMLGARRARDLAALN
jgi:hypothetical protein